jgi:hypothetical protein
MVASFWIWVTAFVGEEEIEFDLWIVDWIGVDNFTEMIPLSDYLFVLWDVGRNRFLEEGTESLY